MSEWRELAERIASVTGGPAPDAVAKGAAGGCINQAVILGSASRRFFVKLNRASRVEMFAAEQLGLEALAASGAIRVPTPICHGCSGERSYLVLEYLELGGSGDEARAGEALAQLHRCHAPRFGWQRDNTIGSTPQPNGWLAGWIDFWRQRRLGYQLQLAGGVLEARGQRLLQQLPALLTHHPRPTLLHGDLWGGNLAYTPQREPVIYDPAVYYGDPETDLAMTELFGGFSPRFYAAYRQINPIDPGYQVRKLLYNLYHVLNHYNLFGGGYYQHSLAIIERLLVEIEG